MQVRCSSNIVFLILLTFGAIAQVEPSSFAGDSIAVSLYQTDADVLTVERFFRNVITHKDSIHIQSAYSDTVLRALIAIFNVTAIPERDSVIDLYNIQTSSYASVSFMAIAADSNLSWMKQLKHDGLTSSISYVDRFINTHYANNYTYSSVVATTICLTCNRVFFYLDSNYNMPPLLNLFDTIAGVYYITPEAYGSISSTHDGFSDLSDSLYSDHIQLTYSKGFGDCDLVCPRRYWKFDLYFDCSVEFVESYGYSIPIGINMNSSPDVIEVSPSPFLSELNIVGLGAGMAHYTI